MSKKESSFQRSLVSELKDIFPNALILKNEGKQGIPDLTIFEGDTWAMLECKRGLDAPHRPNQDYYIEKADSMSFARFISPENKEEVIDALQQALRAGRKTCNPSA